MNDDPLGPREAEPQDSDDLLPERRRPKAIGTLALAFGACGCVALLACLERVKLIGKGWPDETWRLPLQAAAGLLLLATGLGLWRLRPWARVPALVAAVLLLLAFPYGTVLAVPLLLYLLSPGVRALYSARPVDELAPRQRQALAVVDRSVAGNVLWVLIVASFTLLAAFLVFAVPDSLSGLNRGRQKQTMGDLRTIATVIESYAIDNRAYPAGGPTVDAIREFLEPTYVRRLPTLDGWDGPYFYEVDADRQGYRLESYAKDGKDSGPEEGPTTDFRHDIVFANGSFVAYPDGTQG